MQSAGGVEVVTSDDLSGIEAFCIIVQGKWFK